MKICYAISNYHLVELTAQPKIIKLLAEKAKEHYEVFIVSESSLFDLLKISPDIIHSNGYKMTLFICFVNLFLRARHLVFLSETFQTVEPIYRRLVLFCLKGKKIFVTSNYIKQELKERGIESEVVRIGV